MFYLGKPFQTSLMYVRKARRKPRVEQLLGASLGLALALLINIRLGCKDPPGKTLAFPNIF